MRFLLAVMLVSPLTREPSSAMRAVRETLASCGEGRCVRGWREIWEDIWMDPAKSPVMRERAATKRLLKLWPSSWPPAEAELEERREEARGLSSERATMQFQDVASRGAFLKSLRRRPEEPPSSVTVTTAERSRMMQGMVG